MKSENPLKYRFPWESFVFWGLGGAVVLPILSITLFTIVYNTCRGGGLNFYDLFGPADESSGIGAIILCMYHAPIGGILGAISAYCYGEAEQKLWRHAYLMSHWSGLLLGTPALVLTALTLMGAYKGWVLHAFLCAGPLLGALALFASSYYFRRKMARSF